jgi:hypothetical protein
MAGHQPEPVVGVMGPGGRLGQARQPTAGRVIRGVHDGLTRSARPSLTTHGSGRAGKEFAAAPTVIPPGRPGRMVAMDRS